MDGIGFLIAIASFVIAIIALNKAARLDTLTSQLKMQLMQLTTELNELRKAIVHRPVPEPTELLPMSKSHVPEPPPEQPAKKPARAAATKAKAQVRKSEPVAPPVIAVEPLLQRPPEVPAIDTQRTTPPPPPPPPPPPKPAPRGGDMEQALASRWFVWIGGIAIAIGGLLFVKYAYDNGYISPAFQIFLALLAAACLVAAGEWLRRKGRGNADDYVPAALSAAGIVVAFGAIYAAYALYQLISPTTAFLCLGIVGVGAMALSRLQGPLIAALGLLGSYAPPILVSTDQPSAVGFFPYLAVILGASFATLRGRNWWWLGYASIAGSFLWTMAWFAGPFTADDTLIIGVFAHLVGLVAMYAISGRAILAEQSGQLYPQVIIPDPLAIGLAGVVAQNVILLGLCHASNHSTLALELFLLAVAGLVALAWAKDGLNVLAPVASLVALAGIIGWNDVAFHVWAMDENGLWSSVPGPEVSRYLRWTLFTGAALTLAGLAGLRAKGGHWLWAQMASGSAVLFIAAAWGRADSQMAEGAWAALAAVSAIVPLAAAKLLTADHEGDGNRAGGILAAGAALLLAFAADRLFDGVWLTLALAVLAAAYAYGSSMLRAYLMGPITSALATVVTLKLFLSRELWSTDHSLPLGQHWPLYGYGVPVVLFLLGSRWLKSAGHLRSALSLEGASLGLAVSLASLEIRVLIGGGVASDTMTLLELSTHILTWLGAALGLLYRQKLYSSFIVLWGARILFAGSAIAIIGGSLLVLNPAISRDALQGGAVFNALLLAYFAPAVLIWFIARRLAGIGLEHARPWAELLSLGLAVVYLSLEWKRLYTDQWMILPATDEVEAAIHVLIWLGVCCLLLYRAGILSNVAQQTGARALLVLSAAAIVLGALGIFNPVVSGQPVLGNVAFNSLILAYLAPVVLLGLIARRLAGIGWEQIRPAVGLLALMLVFVYVTLETKRVFQGPVLVAHSQSIAESYAYSAVWLALALALFVAGIRLGRQVVRYAGLGVMTLVVLKVFLWDMSSLEGLYRIASFVGLGLCLVAIGWLYQKFVQKPGKDAAA